MYAVVEVLQSDDESRAHPWGKTAYAEKGGAYYDFTKFPEMISSVLEDFRPFEDKPAVQRFYAMLADINGDGSSLETNDSALLGPAPSNSPLFPYAMEATGRLEIFARSHAVNTHRDTLLWLGRMFQLYLQVHRTDFDKGIVTITAVPTDYTLVRDSYGPGYRLRFTFHAYGNSEDEVWDSLDVVFGGIGEAAKRVAHAMTVPIPPFP